MELTHHQKAEILINAAISEIAVYLMADTGCSVIEAMDRIYSSRLLTLLQQEEDELYVQSPSYLYRLLLNEK